MKEQIQPFRVDEFNGVWHYGGDWVLKTLRANKVAENVPVYAISDIGSLPKYVSQLPPYITAIMAGDGRNFPAIDDKTKENCCLLFLFPFC